MKILYVTTLSDTINAFLVPHIEFLLDHGHQVDLACNIQREINPRLLERGCRSFDIKFQRSPISKKNIIAYKQLKKLIIIEKYDIVHTHTPVASACTRIACRKIDGVKVVYTAHGFHFYKGAPIKNWLLYYPVERWLAKHTDMIITINKEDYNRASTFKAGEVVFVPGVGLTTKNFKFGYISKSHKRTELGIPHDAFVVLSVGEINKNKNHVTVIKAVAKLNDPKIFYLICGQGHAESDLKDLICQLGLDQQVKLLGYRKDVNEIYQIADVFAFPSFREGLPVSLMEAMAAGLPVVCSRIRGNIDLIEDGVSGYLGKPDSVDFFYEKLLNYINNSAIREKFGQRNREKIRNYEVEKILNELNAAYSLIYLDKK